LLPIYLVDSTAFTIVGDLGEDKGIAWRSNSGFPNVFPRIPLGKRTCFGIQILCLESSKTRNLIRTYE